MPPIHARRATGILGVAIALGFLESAWTGVGRGGPTNVWLGVFAIFVVLFIVTWPRIEFIPVLAIVEEWTHLIVGYGVWLPTARTLFNHWSIGYLGINAYPWLTFPFLTLAGWLLVRWTRREPRKV